eukprot:4602375-Ditylum_brightwellii.AAC.1
MGRLVVDGDVVELGVGDLRWVFGAVRLVEQGKVGHCVGTLVGNPTMLDARAEPRTCPDGSTTA